MTAILLMLLTSVLGGLTVPAIAYLAAKLGISDPIEIEIWGHTWLFAPWSFFQRKRLQTQSISTGVFTFGNGGQYAFATTVMATIVGTHLMLAEAEPFKTNNFYFAAQNITPGKLVALHA